jgi:hypothetical protein
MQHHGLLFRWCLELRQQTWCKETYSRYHTDDSLSYLQAKPAPRQLLCRVSVAELLPDFQIKEASVRERILNSQVEVSTLKRDDRLKRGPARASLLPSTEEALGTVTQPDVIDVPRPTIPASELFR